MGYFAATTTAESVRACRRCGAEFLVNPRSRFRACPHCGAGVAPLTIRSNGNAAVVALAALGFLLVGMVRPFVAMSELGEHRIFSLLGGIGELWRRGNVVLAAVIFLFSVIFPVAKLLVLLVATSRLVPFSPQARHTMHKTAVAAGKYSMLDIFVVAIMIVLVKFDGVASVAARDGVYWFMAAVLLSMLSGWLVEPGRWKGEA